MKTDNELIADFMQYTGGTWWHFNKHDFTPDSDWSALMPVVEKIAETYDFTIQFYDGDCNCYCTKRTLEGSDIPGVGHGGFKPNINSVYKSVVAFIKWYNNQTK